MGVDFRERLITVLNEHGMTQADLCRASGIPTSLMSNYYKGKSKPTLDNAVAIAQAIGITLDELVGFKPQSLTEREEDLLGMFRELSEDEQQEIYGYTEYKHAKKFLRERSSKEVG